jgi:predicted O-methyltransferase YrrM
MKFVRALRRLAGTPRILENINEGIKNEADMLNNKLMEIKAAIDAADQRPLLGEIRSSLGQPHHNIGNSELPLALEPSPELPFPEVDFQHESDPIDAIANSIEYRKCAQLLEGRLIGATSLMSQHSQALLYATIRNLRPSLLIEIGTYRAGTTKVLCWALAANGYGRLHTIDPYGARFAPNILATWPEYLRRLVSFFPVNSMEYFDALTKSGERSSLTFIDGNHDYEYALFDIEAAARIAAPGGFIFVDNTSQAGPFLAAQDFLQRHPDWTECGGKALSNTITDSPYEVRTKIWGTDFVVLRAPHVSSITERPYTLGQLRWGQPSLQGLRLQVHAGPPGILHTQCVIRTFDLTNVTGEYQIKRSLELRAAGEISVPLDFELDETAKKGTAHITVEPWFIWRGQKPLTIGESALV